MTTISREIEINASKEEVWKAIAKNGGKPVARFKTTHQLTGDDNPDMLSIFEFANADIINEMLNGDDFTALAELRARVFIKLNIVICDEM